ncbi:MAG TPA: GAF and ANTAR domain-containing protein [Amycolatopsis sp.]|nr:GAF and ANTAR domain-containing protein [Amycolatopsis sp.]
MSAPENLVARTFVEVADTPVTGFDFSAFLRTLVTRYVEVLDVEGAGVLVVDGGGAETAGSSDACRRLARLGEGPAWDCRRGGQVVRCTDLARDRERWPQFASAALAAGFESVVAVPMRQREEIAGAVILFGGVDERGLELAQALAEVAAIGILHQRTLRRQQVLVAQLQSALNSRITIEQAKGVLAERLGVDVREAFGVLRSYARGHNRRILDVAGAVVEGVPDRDAIDFRPGP